MYIYMLVYNLSLTVLFWILMNIIISEFKTIYSFSNLSFNSFTVLTLSILLLSMAGVPPFVGFFSKLFLFILLINSSFFLLNAVFFVILFLGLYFYVQNLRFLHSTNKQTINTPFIENERNTISFYYITLAILYLIIFGFMYFDDVLLYMYWLL